MRTWGGLLRLREVVPCASSLAWPRTQRQREVMKIGTPIGLLVTWLTAATMACGGSHPRASLPPPEYDPPVLPAWHADDAGTIASGAQQGIAEPLSTDERMSHDAGD